MTNCRDCERPLYALSLCKLHYMHQWKVNGAQPQIPITDRFWSKVDKSGDCWIWTAALTNGYGHFRLPGRADMRAHRFSWTLKHGQIPTGALVLHRCDVRSCVKPAHLFLGTHADNMMDAAIKGRKGLKLSIEAVRSIKARLADGDTQTSIAQWANVSISTINLIANGRVWNHVEV